MRKPLFTLALFLPLSVMAQVFNVQNVEQVTLPNGSEMVADISPDGNSLLLTTGNNRGLKSFNLTSGNTVVLSENEGAGYGACFTPSGDAVLFRETSYTRQHLRMTSLHSIDLNTQKKVELQAATRNLQGVRLTANGATVINKGKVRAKAINGKKAKLSVQKA